MAGVRVLFGSIFGLDPARAVTAAAISVGVLAVLLAIARPLLFASIDPQVAAARGLPVGWLSVVFLGAVGATAAVATQAIGALLIVGLLAAPAGAARHLTDRPYVAMAWSTGLAVLSMVAGILVSVLLPWVPPSFAILAVASLGYLAGFLTGGSSDGGRARPPRGADPSVRPVDCGAARQCLASWVKNAGPFGEPTPVSLSYPGVSSNVPPWLSIVSNLKVSPLLWLTKLVKSVRTWVTGVFGATRSCRAEDAQQRVVQRVDEAERVARLLVGHGDQAGQQRRGQARPADPVLVVVGAVRRTSGSHRPAAPCWGHPASRCPG